MREMLLAGKQLLLSISMAAHTLRVCFNTELTKATFLSEHKNGLAFLQLTFLQCICKLIKWKEQI